MCETFGRVPMWFYLKHLLVIHAAAIVVMWIRTGSPHLDWFATAPYSSVPGEAPGAVLRWAYCCQFHARICMLPPPPERLRRGG